MRPLQTTKKSIEVAVMIGTFTRNSSMLKIFGVFQLLTFPFAGITLSLTDIINSMMMTFCLNPH